MKKSPTIKSIEVVWLICWYPGNRKMKLGKRPVWCKKYNKKMKPCVYCLDVPKKTKCKYIGVTSWPKKEVEYAKNAIHKKFKGPICFTRKEVDLEKKIVRLKYKTRFRKSSA